MTETAAMNLNVILQSVRRSNSTKEQVFRLWRCAIKDDDELVDDVFNVYTRISSRSIARVRKVRGG
jgi:hypothetical protein